MENRTSTAYGVYLVPPASLSFVLPLRSFLAPRYASLRGGSIRGRFAHAIAGSRYALYAHQILQIW